MGGTNDSGPRKGKKINYAKQSMAKLMEQGKDQLRNAKTFHHEYGPGPEDKVIWDILGDGEEILEDVMTHPLLMGMHSRSAPIQFVTDRCVTFVIIIER